MAREGGKQDFEDFDARLRRLRAEARLPDPDAEPEQARPPRMVGGAGAQVGIELVAGVIGGALMGYGLDSWFGTWPILFLIMFFLGSAAGMLNAYRYIRRASEQVEHEIRQRKESQR
jgi:ATP synthase protein I